MKPHQKTNKDQLLKTLGIFSTSEAIDAGISQPTLSRLATSGKIIRLEHGLYIHPHAGLDPLELDFAIACAKFGPKSAIGGISALFRHQLISQVPNQIWVIVPASSKTRNPLYRCIRTKNSPAVGIEDHGIYRITNLERSIIEAFQFSGKIGLEIAISAARHAVHHGLTTDKKLQTMGNQLGAINPFNKYWEAVVAE
jgi:predicted transcriptional regulator of viral defense system